MQATNHILLVQPAHFTFNLETAGSNAFQSELKESQESVKQKVVLEFEKFASVLESKGVDITVVKDTPFPLKPDAVFPNNWISFHENGTIILYPMFAPNRRLERREDIIESIKKNFVVSTILDLSKYEQQNKFLEGTGSIVFDHVNKIAYACLSPRTDKDIFIETCTFLNYKPVYFIAEDEQGKQIYHTNVMMCVAEKFAVVCMESITNPKEREMVATSLIQSGHELIDITFPQMNCFSGNMLELLSNKGKHLLAMSASSYAHLTPAQKQQLEKFCEIVPLSVPTIETIGGGSVRCMIAEVFLRSKQPSVSV